MQVNKRYQATGFDAPEFLVLYTNGDIAFCSYEFQGMKRYAMIIKQDWPTYKEVNHTSAACPLAH